MRIVVLVLLGYLALHSINVVAIEGAARHGATGEILGRVAVPLIFVLAMLVIVLWTKKKVTESDE